MAYKCSGSLFISKALTDGTMIVNTYGTGGKTPEWVKLLISGRYNLDPMVDTLPHFHIVDMDLYASFLSSDLKGRWQGEFIWYGRDEASRWFDYVVPLFPSSFKVEVGVELEFEQVGTGRRFRRRHDVSLGALRADSYGLFNSDVTDGVEWDLGKPGPARARTAASSGQAASSSSATTDREQPGTQSALGQQAAGRPPASAASSTGSATGPLVENTTWRYGVSASDANPFTLSAGADHWMASEPITELSPGEFYVFYFKVQHVSDKGRYGKALEILNGTEKPSGWAFYFVPGQERMRSGKLRMNGEYMNDLGFDVAWYKPGAWNKVRMSYQRDGHLDLEINGSPVQRRLKVGGKRSIPLVTKVVGMAVAFDG